MIPLSMEDFEWGWRIAHAAASGAMPMKSPANRGSVSVQNDDTGAVAKVGFQDTVISRMLFAVKDHFGAESPKWKSFMIRYWALQELEDDKRMQRWTRATEKETLFFEGLMEAAAALPLNDEGNFDSDQFFATVEAVNDSGKYLHTGEIW